MFIAGFRCPAAISCSDLINGRHEAGRYVTPSAEQLPRNAKRPFRSVRAASKETSRAKPKIIRSQKTDACNHVSVFFARAEACRSKTRGPSPEGHSLVGLQNEILALCGGGPEGLPMPSN